MKKMFDIAVVGATGMVGSILLQLLAERKFPIKNLYLLASERSTGVSISFIGKKYSVELIDGFDFTKTQICFFCVGNDVAAKFAPIAEAAGNFVIDKSSYFRMDSEIPLIVPEVNGEILDPQKNKIIASPNCTTIPIVMALKPLHDAVGLARLNVATYQSVSGSGRDAVDELTEQTAGLLRGEIIQPKVYPQQISFNVIPFIDSLEENGYTREEMKVVNETRKILQHDKLPVHATAVRVPVFYGHSIAVQIETHELLSVADAKKILGDKSGIKLFSDPATYPTPVHDAAGHDEVFVGRLRKDLSSEKGICFWLVCDNLRKGAALNAVQIAEYLTQ